VDDGKSSLIGRLLFDSQKIPADQLAAVQRDSARWGTTGDAIDLALLVDGLQAEREQGITIDVAYRYFETDRRKYIIADTPGHEQYTRNMVTGASTSQAAVILVDATRGAGIQTRRHALIVALLGIRHVLVAVNKMDLVGYREEIFTGIRDACERFMRAAGIPDVSVVPVSALTGDNVVTRSPAMPWYGGAPLLDWLETLDVTTDDTLDDLRFPVQWVNRPHADFRGYAGTVEAGHVRVGDPIMVLPSRRLSRIKTIGTFAGEQDHAHAGQAITLTLEHEIDVSRGDVLVHSDRAPSVADRFDAHVIWMADAPLLPGRAYQLKIGTAVVVATIETILSRVNIDDPGDHAMHPVDHLSLNEIAMCRIATSAPIVFDAYETCRVMGSFILIDRQRLTTVGAGMIRRSAGPAVADLSGAVVWEPTRVTPQQRANQKGQKPCVLWFTGLSGAGKSTVANAVEQALFLRGHHSYLLDGDNVRHGLNRDLDFTDAGRVENIRRIGEVAKLFVDAGVIVLAAFISPFRSDRQMARDLVGDGEFVEIYMSASLDVCETRDPKGLYVKARSGEVKHFTGVTSPYEAPEKPELTLDTATTSLPACVSAIVRYLEATGRLKD
jgi:bifunctional enzyme CysN/CysC